MNDPGREELPGAAVEGGPGTVLSPMGMVFDIGMG